MTGSTRKGALSPDDNSSMKGELPSVVELECNRLWVLKNSGMEGSLWVLEWYRLFASLIGDSLRRCR